MPRRNFLGTSDGILSEFSNRILSDLLMQLSHDCFLRIPNKTLSQLLKEVSRRNSLKLPDGILLHFQMEFSQNWRTSHRIPDGISSELPEEFPFRISDRIIWVFQIELSLHCRRDSLTISDGTLLEFRSTTPNSSRFPDGVLFELQTEL